MKIWAENCCWPQADHPTPINLSQRHQNPGTPQQGRSTYSRHLVLLLEKWLGNGQRRWGVRSPLTYSLLYHLWRGITHWPFQTVLKFKIIFRVTLRHDFPFPLSFSLKCTVSGVSGGCMVCDRTMDGTQRQSWDFRCHLLRQDQSNTTLDTISFCFGKYSYGQMQWPYYSYF